MKNLKVSMKLFVGFGITVALLLIVGITSAKALRQVDTSYSKTIDVHGAPLADAGQILEAIHAMRAELRGIVIFDGNKEKIQEFRKLQDANYAEFEDHLKALGPFLIRPDTKQLMEEALNSYEKVFKPTCDDIMNRAEKGTPVAELTGEMINVAYPAAVKMAENMKKCMEIKVGMLRKSQEEGHETAQSTYVTTIVLLIIGCVLSIILGFYISSLISNPLASTVKMLSELERGHLDMRLHLNRADEIGAMAKSMDAFADNLQHIVVDTMKKISDGDLSVKINLTDSRDEISAALKGTVEALNSLIIDDGGHVLLAAARKDMSQRMTHNYKGDYAKMKDNINTLMQNLDTALSHVVETVSEVTKASTEISRGAQNLAEGANEQASSLEEVSSSLEEISSMTKQNAENSNQAKVLAVEARTAADEGDAAMKRMAEAINEIKQSADNTSKIIKTIDDIAFQTNLLALNAAVEAARAGDAGKGFAVVAGEVRNLAQRSAEAAKNTASMIQESVKSAAGGVKITQEVAKSLNQIVDRADKVSNLIAEIASASNEQAAGIEQVNTAVTSMNQVTQSNAANSEESASASEELSGQAMELAKMVSEFKLTDVQHIVPDNARRLSPTPQKRPILAALPNKTGNKQKPITKSMKSVRAEEIIPLDDGDLNDF